MENKVYDVLVNFEGAGSISSDPIAIATGDYNSVTLKFEMSKTDYLLAMFYLIKPNGKYFASLIENSQVTFETSDIFDEKGYYHYGVALYDEDSKLTNASKGIIKVIDNGSRAVSLDATEDSNFQVLDDLINKVTKLNSDVKETVSDINAYNENAEEKLSLFNLNYQQKLDNINANILTYEENENYDPYAESKRIEDIIKTHYAMTPDDRTYTVKFPLFGTSHSSSGEKLDDNIDKYVHLATDMIREESNYPTSWDTFDCNAVVDENGVRHITALKGMPNFKDTGKIDVFVLYRTFYLKVWIEGGYIYISKRYVPTEGYTVVPQAINKDGSINPWFTMGKYAVGNIDGVLYSSKGLIPAHYIGDSSPYSNNINYNDCVTKMHKKGKYYSAGLMSDYMIILINFYLKFATRNTQSIMAGNTFNSYQYSVSQAEVNVNRVILTTSQANNFDLNTYVSVGDPTTNTNYDRVHGYMHNIAYNVKIIDKEVIDDTHTALILDCAPFTTTATTYVSAMHEISGYSDYILGRHGSIGSNTNGKHGFVFEGIELNVGGYEVCGNAFMDILDETGVRDIYFTNDASKLTTNMTTAKTTYKKSGTKTLPHTNGAWKYITDMTFDLANGLYIPTGAGESGSGTSTGYADGFITDNASSGQREFLLLGALASNGLAGLSCLLGSHRIGAGNWYLLARLSINGVGGELAE